MTLPRGERADLLMRLGTATGIDVEKLVYEIGLDAASPAICTTCHFTTETEPDQANGHCAGCGNDTVVATLVLAGLI